MQQHKATILAALKFAALKHEAFWALGAPDDRPSESLQRLKDAIAAVEAWQEIVTNGEKLLPCPFCGTEPSIEADGLGGTIIACDNDDCPVVVEYTHHVSTLEATQDWNRRVTPPPSPDEVNT